MSEYTEVERPFLQQLKRQGWVIIDHGAQGIPQNPADSLRDNFRQWLLPEVFDQAVCSINKTETGNAWLTDDQLETLRGQLLNHPNRTLLEANEALQRLLFKAQVDVNEITGEEDPVVRLIDFDQPANNTFHAINQFRLDTPGCVKQCIIPDIVLFVNGIPLVVVECKKGSETCANPMQEAFVQLQRYMRKRKATELAGLKEGEPHLFYSNLLVMRTCGTQADFGTITSGDEHFYAWKTAYPEDDALMDGRSAQERLIAGMLTHTNLLSILRTCSVFMNTDSGPRIKVVCRYQQFRAANRIMERLRQEESVLERSGVVWHTQGSGKSLTMVFLARMLRANKDLADMKILLVNDRQDLENQLAETATLIGGRVNIIDSTASLRQHLATDSSDNMVMVHKFQDRKQMLSTTVSEVLGTFASMPAKETFGVVNPSSRIILMIDEAHRTQGSDLGDNLFETFPNAARIAFTGTPLLTKRHGEKKTHKRFGEYIDTYKLMDAVNDGATLQILYEGKTADSAVNEKHQLDQVFEDLFRDRSEKEILAIKKKYGATGDILEAEARINAIAEDMVNHYVDNILPNGFKAQVVCHSKLACVRYQKGINTAIESRVEKEKQKEESDKSLLKLLTFLKTAVIISSDGTNEPTYVTQARKEAMRLNAVDNFCKPFDLSEPDKENTGIAFLIVCDMLLTGFDAPVEQVIYIDKRLREHTLLQAIARTNRVKKGKKRGYVVDYIGLANHLASALSLYAYSDELQELHDGMKDIASEVPVLEERYERLLQFFRQDGVAEIAAFVTGALPDTEADARVVHKAVKVLADEKKRADFEVKLKQFLTSMDVILPNLQAQPFRVPAKRFGYIMQVAKERYKDNSLDFGDAGEKIKQLINQHLVSLGINPRVEPVELLDDTFLESVNKRNKDNAEAKASEMEHALRKHCTVHHDEDPAFYKKLSQKIDSLIEQHKNQWDALAESLAKLRDEAIEGRQQGQEGMSNEASVFYEHIVQTGFEKGVVPETDVVSFRELMETIVYILQDTIGSIDFRDQTGKRRILLLSVMA